jgi:hypothetical protein
MFDRYWDEECEYQYILAQRCFWWAMLVALTTIAVLM